MVLFLASRALGLLREVVIARQFGTSAEMDAYLAAFRLPDFLFYVVAGGALGSAFIPVFTGCLTRQDLPGAWRLASAVINWIILILTGSGRPGRYFCALAGADVLRRLYPGSAGANHRIDALDAHLHRDFWRQRRGYGNFERPPPFFSTGSGPGDLQRRHYFGSVAARPNLGGTRFDCRGGARGGGSLAGATAGSGLRRAAALSTYVGLAQCRSARGGSTDGTAGVGAGRGAVEFCGQCGAGGWFKYQAAWPP